MISIRVDDFPQTKGEPQHTLGAYREFDVCLRECIGGKRYLLGVIPGRCTSDDLTFLRNETDCVIGMHGINHDENRLDLYGNEFPPYLSRTDIGKMLSISSLFLEEAVGREVTIYMPPRNNIDTRTISVLSSADFVNFTTGPGTPSDVLLNRAELGGIHSTPPHEYGRTDEMIERGACEVLVSNDISKKVVLTLHWTWETNIGLEHMKKFFSKIPKEYFEDFSP